MIARPTAATRLFALLGNPVSHSLSPAFQNAAISELGLDAVYVALRCKDEDVAGLVQGIARAGGGGNVTVPHKERAAEAVERRTEAVERTGSCNTFWFEGGNVCGDNTDVAGLSAALRSLLGTSPTSARILLIGAGGAARGAAYALIQDGASEIVVLNRSREKAERLVSTFRGGATAIRLAGSPDDLKGEVFDLAVNATSLGLRAGDPLPLPDSSTIELRAGFDLVYAPDETPWVRRLRAGGIPAEDGLEMLLQQGVAAFERWWGRPAPVHAMRAALPTRAG